MDANDAMFHGFSIILHNFPSFMEKARKLFPSGSSEEVFEV
jgi:hypothetical protein